MRAVGRVVFLCCAVAAGCASQSADSNQRLSAMEARLARIEGLLAPDASPAPQATLDQDAGVILVADAMPDAMPRLPPRKDTAAQLLACKNAAEQECAQGVLEERTKQTRARNGGFAWVETAPLPAADSTLAGRACLQRLHKQCERPTAREKRIEWLDTQLASGKRDDALTNRIRARIAKKMGAPEESVDVACVPQFCRFGPAVGAPWPDLGDDFSGGGMTSGEGYWYAMRTGYHLSSEPPPARANSWGKAE